MVAAAAAWEATALQTAGYPPNRGAADDEAVSERDALKRTAALLIQEANTK
jgi:hypothetical protein